LRQFFWPVATMMLADLVFIFTYNPHPGVYLPSTTAAYFVIYALAVTLVIDLPALIWRGLWNGLLCGTALAGMRKTLIELILVPFPFFLLSISIPVWLLSVGEPVFRFLGFGFAYEDAEMIIGLLLCWCLVSFVADTLWVRQARQNLSLYTRYIAAAPGAARTHLLASVRRLRLVS